MIHKKWLAVFGILTLLLLGSCGGIGKTPKVCKDKLTPVKQMAHAFPKVSSVGIYLDTTPSMKGFLYTPKEASTPNYYISCLTELGNMTAASYREEDTHFYRVDTSVWEAPENVLTEAQNSGYYKKSECLIKNEGKEYDDVLNGNDVLKCDDDSYPFPCLTAALQHGQLEDFFILITDLYENKSENAPKLINAFQELAGMDDGKVFGFFTVRTHFSGKIYDVGPDNQIVDYDGPRPFYVVVRGYPEAVSDFIDKLDEHLQITDEDYAREIFYIPSFPGLDYQNFIKCIVDDELIWEKGDTKVSINDTDELPAYDYMGDSDKLSEEMMFSYSVPDFLLDEFKEFAEKTGSWETVKIGGIDKQVYQLTIPASETQISLWSEGDQEFQSRKGAGGSFTVNRLLYDDDQGILYAGLQIKDFTQGIWRLQWRNVVNQEDEDSTWWKAWGSYSGSDDYTKTERLGNYVNAIKGSVTREELCILNGTVYLKVKG